MTRFVKVNADYELVLFENKETPKIINQSLEFLALYLEGRPLYSSKKYSQEYLQHVADITGNLPEVVGQGKFENWWGELKDISLEKKLNSKELSASLSDETQLVSQADELKLVPDRTYLVKSPYGMSGQNFLVLKKGEEGKLEPLFAKAPRLIVEPLFNRVSDFSHYVFSPQEIICYENLIDEKFQYKGTLFCNLKKPDPQHLRFYSHLAESEWQKFSLELKKIINTYLSEGARSGYSIDSFTYLENGMTKIRALSEVNYRKTMGLMAWLLSQKFCGENSWSLLILGKPLKQKDAFKVVKESIKSIAWNKHHSKGCLQLSPGDTRFEMFFLSAASPEEGQKLYKELQRLLPDSQLSIDI